MPNLRRNVFSGVVLAVGNTLLILVGYPFYLKYLGTEIYGLWATLSIVVNFTIIGRLGVDTAMIKYVAEEYGRNNKLAIEKYFSTATITLMIGGALIFFALLLLKGFVIGVLNIPDQYALLASNLLPCMVALSIFIFLIKITDGTLRGLGRVDLANYYDLGGRSVSILTAVIMLSLGHGIWSLFWGQVIFHILVGFLTFYTVYSRLGSIFFSVRSFDFSYLKRMIGFGGTMTLAQLISMFLTPFNKAVIARYISLSGVTYFDIANRASGQIRSVFLMGVRAIMPEVSRLSSSEGYNSSIDRILRKAVKLVSILGIPVFIAFSFLGSFLLRFWLSDQFAPEIANLFIILLAGYTVNLLSIPIYFLFMGMGKVIYCFVNHLVQAILNLVLVSILIGLEFSNLYLVAGVYSTSVAVSAILLIGLFISYRKAGFRRNYGECG